MNVLRITKNRRYNHLVFAINEMKFADTNYLFFEIDEKSRENFFKFDSFYLSSLVYFIMKDHRAAGAEVLGLDRRLDSRVALHLPADVDL